MDFKDKVALVTGASSGIGRAVALAFGRSGALVGVADIREDKGEKTTAAIRDQGGNAIFVRCDVSKCEQVKTLVSKIVHRYGKLDVCCNNAGVVKYGSAVELNEKDWDYVIDVNLKGMWLCMKYEIEHMLIKGAGAIVNISSVAGLVGFLPTAYVASKHGVVGLTKSVALQYASKGIRVNAVCPGFIPTEMTAGITNDLERSARVISKTPLGRWGTPEEIAEAVLWLCSDKASFVTGHAMAVDGGLTVP